MPRVSVIVPNYNHAPFLKERLDSVFNQTYQDFEVILLDDCSIDKSSQILKKYESHPKVSSLSINDTNSGSTFIQWHRGIELAKGEIIWIAESDDYADSHFLECLIAPFQTNTDLAISFCQSKIIDENSNLIEDRSGTESTRVYTGVQFVNDRMIHGNAIYNASMALFKKDLVTKLLLEETSRFRYCGDWYFWVNLASVGQVFESKDALNYFRTHSRNVSTSAEEKGLFFIEGYRVFMHLVQKKLIRTKNSNIKGWAYKFHTAKFKPGVKSTILFTNFPKNILFFFYVTIFKIYALLNLKQKL